MSKKIETYQDLIDSKKDLRKEVISIESGIKNNRIVQFSNLLVSNKSLKSSTLDSYHLPHVKDLIASPIGNIVSTFLLSNKKIRKYFIAFVVIREAVPFAVSEIKKIIEEQK